MQVRIKSYRRNIITILSIIFLSLLTCNTYKRKTFCLGKNIAFPKITNQYCYTKMLYNRLFLPSIKIVFPKYTHFSREFKLSIMSKSSIVYCSTNITCSRYKLTIFCREKRFSHLTLKNIFVFRIKKGVLIILYIYMHTLKVLSELHIL